MSSFPVDMALEFTQCPHCGLTDTDLLPAFRGPARNPKRGEALERWRGCEHCGCEWFEIASLLEIRVVFVGRAGNALMDAGLFKRLNTFDYSSRKGQ